ncbi:MAG: ABC transporter substrate-binding protein [Methanomassiliicoccaceae archaeon]|nr:ABC transporter substrate-binding protein [Methanomassiliicoccaceae archaeon]
MVIGQKTIIVVVALVAMIIVAGAAVFVLTSSDKESSGAVTLIDGDDRTITITSSDRIVSLDYSQIENICAIGGYSKLVGVTVNNNNYTYASPDRILGMSDDGFPQSVVNGMNNGTIKNLGPNGSVTSETVLSANPDLVIAAPHGSSADTVSQLENMGITVIMCRPNTSLENFYFNIELMGKAIGKESAATTVVEQMKSAIGKIADWTKSINEVPQIGMFISFSETGGAWAIGDQFYKGTTLIEMLGGVNAFSISENYLLTSHEGIIAVNPNIIISGTAYGPIDYIHTDPILKSLTAVQTERVYSFIGLSSSPWSSTSIEFVNAIALVAMFMYEDYLDFEIPHKMGDDYMDYLNKFWNQINV